MLLLTSIINADDDNDYIISRSAVTSLFLYIVRMGQLQQKATHAFGGYSRRCSAHCSLTCVSRCVSPCERVPVKAEFTGYPALNLSPVVLHLIVTVLLPKCVVLGS